MKKTLIAILVLFVASSLLSAKTVVSKPVKATVAVTKNAEVKVTKKAKKGKFAAEIKKVEATVTKDVKAVETKLTKKGKK